MLGCGSNDFSVSERRGDLSRCRKFNDADHELGYGALPGVGLRFLVFVCDAKIKKSHFTLFDCEGESTEVHGQGPCTIAQMGEKTKALPRTQTRFSNRASFEAAIRRKSLQSSNTHDRAPAEAGIIRSRKFHVENKNVYLDQPPVEVGLRGYQHRFQW